MDGNLIPMPITLETLNTLYNTDFTPEQMGQFLKEKAVKILEIRTSKYVAFSRVGEEIYEKMAYRSLNFVFEAHDIEEYQPALVVNYPNDYDFTRITKFKKLTGQKHAKTTILKEFPKGEGKPYYLFPTKEYKEQFAKYQEEMRKETKVQKPV